MTAPMSGDIKVKCPACRAETAADSKFCGECGGPCQPPSTCPKCGFSNLPGTRFCRECGQELARTPEAAAAAANSELEAKLAEARLADARLAEVRLSEVLAAIRGAVGTAEASATEALDTLALEQKLAPVRKGARVIREIAWRLREIGNDGRICDLIDSQVAVIEAGAGTISSEQAKAALNAAFASLESRLAELGNDAAPAPAAEAETAEAIAAELDELPLPYRFDVQAYEAIRYQPLREHIDRVGKSFYARTEPRLAAK